MTKVAINGLGRIGRALLKNILKDSSLQLVAVNDLESARDAAYLLNYDSVYRRYDKNVTVESGESQLLMIENRRIKMFNKKDPSDLPWRDLDIDIVFECTGVFRKKDQLQKHLDAGAKTVILSAPAKDDEITTVVHAVNRADLNDKIFSTASCTTNCITPIVEVMDRRIGVEKALMSTVHAYTASQHLVDAASKKTRRGRAAAFNFVPTSTGAAKATAKALPHFKDRFDGVAIRGPVPCGSLADITFLMKRETSREEISEIFIEEAHSKKYSHVLGVTSEPLVSSDIIGEDYASLVDLSMTQVVGGNLVKILSWYDNEWGYAKQMLREAERIARERSL